MKTAKSIKNKLTGGVFENPNQHLLAYAKGDSDNWEIIYDEESGVAEETRHTEEQLKALSMKDLQTLAEDLECDKRRKDSLIDAILNRGR